MAFYEARKYILHLENKLKLIKKKIDNNFKFGSKNKVPLRLFTYSLTAKTNFLSNHYSSSIYAITLIFVECDTDQDCKDMGPASNTCDKTSGEPVCKCGTSTHACSGDTPICVNDACKGKVSLHENDSLW